MYSFISNISAKAFYSLKELISSIKNDERGLSGVVVAILLILIAVLAVVMIWGFLSGWLREIWDNIAGQAGSIS